MPTLTISTPDSFRFSATVLSHGWVQLPPFSHDQQYTMVHRVQQLSDSAIVHLHITMGDNESLHVVVDGIQGRLSAKQRDEITHIVRLCFNLDLDLRDFYKLLRGEARYAWVQPAGAGRLLRAPTVWEDLAKTLMTTNTTWSQTRQMVARMTTLGDEYADDLHAFPTPERLAAMSLDSLAESVRAGYRNDYLHELANNIASGHVDAEEWAKIDLPAKDLFKLVTALKGFGAYAAGNMLKLIGSFDELAIDSVARAMFAHEFNKDEKVSDADIEAHYEHYGEWRGLVIWMDIMRRWFDE